MAGEIRAVSIGRVNRTGQSRSVRDRSECGYDFSYSLVCALIGIGIVQKMSLLRCRPRKPASVAFPQFHRSLKRYEQCDP